MTTEQLRAEFEAWYEKQMGESPRIAEDMYTPFATACWEGYQAGRAAMQSQDREEIMEMALCESRHLMLRIGQAYRFVPMEGCKTCEEMKAEHDKAYSIARLSR